MLITDLIDREKTVLIDLQKNQEIEYLNFLIHPYTSEKKYFYSKDYYYPMSSRKEKDNCRVKFSISDFAIEQYFDDGYYRDFRGSLRSALCFISNSINSLKSLLSIFSKIYVLLS